MERIRLGKTNMLVTKLGFGGIPIQRVPEEDAIAVVRRCLDLGIQYIDTANAYTTSEGCIGKAIKGRENGIILASKTTARDADSITKHLALTLQRLGVGCIDLYQLHNVSSQASLDKVLAPGGALSVLEEAKKAGKIKHIGVTSHQIDIAKRAVASDKFETIMFPLNCIASEAADELLPLTRKHDVGFIAMKPLAGGALSNAAIAFKYLLQFPDIVIIPGIERIEEIDEIVGLYGKPTSLTKADKNEIARLRQEIGQRFCHRCDYCQPCTEDIPISVVLLYPSLARRMSPKTVYSGPTADAMEAAEHCTECGDCEERCPYHLPIREMLKEYVGRYKADKLKYTAR